MGTKDLIITYVSDPIVRELGYKTDELLGQSLLEFVLNESAGQFHSEIKKQLESIQLSNKKMHLLTEIQMYHKLGYLV
jgi:hypothetical protein